MIEPELLPEVFRFDQRRETGAQVDRLTVRGRQQLAIPPDSVRSLRDRLAADPLPDGIQVVGDLERSETVLAEVGGCELPQSSALSTPQLLHRIPPRRLIAPTLPSPRGGGK